MKILLAVAVGFALGNAVGFALGNWAGAGDMADCVKRGGTHFGAWGFGLCLNDKNERVWPPLHRTTPQKEG